VTPMSTTTRDALWAKAAALIDRLADGSRDDCARDALLAEALAWQAEVVVPYRRLVETRRPSTVRAPQTPDDWPALPTDVFRFARVACYPASEDQRVFRTSGTTGGRRGSLPLRDLSLYDRAAQAAARYALFPDRDRLCLILLAPLSEQASDSSLSYMLTRFRDWFGEPGSLSVWRDGGLRCEALAEALDSASKNKQPVALLGASFAFVYAEDALGARRWALPPGSRIMATGGFKGRSRQIERRDLDRALTLRYGIETDWIVQEYGMTELSSQMYETSLRGAAIGPAGSQRKFWAPGWMRCTVVDPETLAPIEGDRIGLLRIDDLANIDSVCAVQTSDLARRVDDGFILEGRAVDAPLRGCSLAVEEALGR
jgi:hypothetical protein